MGVIWRYLDRLSALLRPRRAAAPAVSADGEGLLIGGVQVVWRDVCRLDAYKRDIYVGDFLCLTILAAGGRVFEINEESPGWQEVGHMIEQFLPGSLPHTEWALRLFAAKPGQSVAIYHVIAEK
jgi:hypothetical protein